MVDRIKFQMKGVEELTRRMKLVGDEMATKAGQSAIRAAAKVVADEWKQSVPVSNEDDRSPMSVQYGHLRDNIRVRKGRPKKAHNVVSNVTAGNAFWARFLEYGTVKLRQQPTFKPAFDRSAPKALAVLEDRLGKSLDRIIKRLGGK